MNRLRNLLFVAAGIVLIAVAGFCSLYGRGGVPVREVTVHYGTFSTKLPETGVVQLPQLVILPAAVAGNLGYVYVRAGDRVSRGQLLATIVNEQITSNVQTAQDSAASADAHAQSVAETNAALPAQNRSSVAQAVAGVVQARSELTQAQQDLVAGSQSGLGYGGSTAQEQRVEADTTLAKAATDLHEAQRVYVANQYLYSQQGVSRDVLMQSQARYDEARATYAQALSERDILAGQLAREKQVLRDRVSSAQDGLRQALAALASAKANAGDTKAGDVLAAQADAAHAESELSFARTQADQLEIHAPFDGIIESVASEPNDTLRPLQPGDAVTQGQALISMAQDNDFIVRTKVDEQDVAGLALGQQAIVSGEDFAGATLTGHVVAISPIAQKSDDPSNTSRQIVTTIALDRRLPFLRDGMSVDVDIVTHDERHVLAVPSDAIRKDDNGSYVFVVRDGRAVRTAVSAGAENDTETIVTKGLADGDTVVVDKSDAVVDGVAVEPAPSPTPT